jgi:dTDP-4-amino-4,6-dideoxygalactose transaminase
VSGRPAILGGTPLREGKSWPRWPQWDESEREALLGVLESGRWSSSAGGTLAGDWATEFAASQGARFGLPVTNGTQTIEAALAACGVGEGDEVIVPAWTFVATASAALAVNATPVVVDIDPRTFCLDVEAAAAAVTERTKAIVPVHLGGVAADMDAIGALAAAHGLAVIEDAAHAQGSSWRGRGLGSIGDFGSFSFEAHKLITAGEGGALITNDEARRAAAWSYVNCGRVEGEHWYHHPNYGSNMRMSEWQAAVLGAQLKRLAGQQELRAARGARLDAELEALAGIAPQAADERMDRRGRYAYVFDYDPAAFAGLAPDLFRDALAAEGIEVGVGYPPIHKLGFFRNANFAPRLRASAPRQNYATLHLPVAEAASESTVWVSHQTLLADEEDLLDVPRAIERVRAHAAAVGRPNSPRARFARAARRLRQYG